MVSVSVLSQACGWIWTEHFLLWLKVDHEMLMAVIVICVALRRHWQHLQKTCAVKRVYTAPCLKKTSHLWLAITLTHMNGFWYFFGRNVTDKVYNQKMLYCATLNNLCFCTTWQNGETWKSHFHSVGLSYTHNALSSWKKKLSSVMCLIASNICWDSKISY